MARRNYRPLLFRDQDERLPHVTALLPNVQEAEVVACEDDITDSQLFLGSLDAVDQLECLEEEEVNSSLIVSASQDPAIRGSCELVYRGPLQSVPADLL